MLINILKNMKYTILTLKHGVYSNFTFNNIPISNSDTVRYLGLNLDSRLTCNTHIQIKRLTLNNRMLRPLLIINKYTILKTESWFIKLFSNLFEPMHYSSETSEKI